MRAFDLLRGPERCGAIVDALSVVGVEKKNRRRIERLEVVDEGDACEMTARMLRLAAAQPVAQKAAGGRRTGSEPAVNRSRSNEAGGMLRLAAAQPVAQKAAGGRRTGSEPAVNRSRSNEAGDRAKRTDSSKQMQFSTVTCREAGRPDSRCRRSRWRAGRTAEAAAGIEAGPRLRRNDSAGGSEPPASAVRRLPVIRRGRAAA